MKLIHVFSIFGTAQSFFDGQFKYLTDCGYEIIVVSSDSPDVVDFCRKNNVRFVPVDIPRSVSPIAIARAIKALCVLIKKEKADAVFGHTPVGALCAMSAARLCGVRNRIYYRHGLIYTTMHGLKRLIFKNEERFVSALSTKIINVSHSLSTLALSDKLNSRKKQYVIGRGTCGGIDAENLFNPQLIDDAKLSHLRASLHLHTDDLVFGFCGRICNDKGIRELVYGFELFRLRNSKTSAKLLFVGRLDTRDGISEDLKNEIANNPYIITTGSIAKECIPYYYSLFDAFVFPSHREGFGMCVLEASAMEKPILVSRSHGCIDSIEEHLTGEYIELFPEGICAGMEMMLNENLRKSLGANGRKWILQHFDKDVMWPQVRELYATILSAANHRQRR